MTMLVNYPSKRALKAEIGSELRYRETSVFGEEFRRDGSFSVAYRPSIWKHKEGGREFFARVTTADGKIAKVE